MTPKYGNQKPMALAISSRQRTPVSRPKVPPPTAGYEDVQAFLVQFLIALDCRINLDEAKKMAQKVAGDGKAIYEYGEQVWTNALGDIGETIHHELQYSQYGYVSHNSKSRDKTNCIKY